MAVEVSSRDSATTCAIEADIREPKTDDSSSVVETEQIHVDGPIDVKVHNVACCFSTKCHINLKAYALNAVNVVYERHRGVVAKQLRNPRCYAKVHSSGKVVIVGVQSEADAAKAARRVARQLQKHFPTARFSNFKITNILATCKLPFGVRIAEIPASYSNEASYEPELNTGLIWHCLEPKATLTVHSTGSVTITGANSVEAVELALGSVYPVLCEFACAPTASESVASRRRNAQRGAFDQRFATPAYDDEDYGDDETDEEDDEDDFDEVDGVF